jgi:hypothetical protein
MIRGNKNLLFAARMSQREKANVWPVIVVMLRRVLRFS